MDSHPFFLAVLDGLEAAALGSTVSQQILQIFLEPKKSKHYSQENEIALDIYNIIIVYRKRDRQQLSIHLHIVSMLIPNNSKKSQSPFPSPVLWDIWIPRPGYHSTGAQHSGRLRNCETLRSKRANGQRNSKTW